MEFTGKVHIREVEKKNVDLTATQADTWVKRVLERAAPLEAITGLSPEAWTAGVENFQTTVSVEKMGGDYLVRGNVSARVPAPCSRCGDIFQTSRDAEFKVVMHRLPKGSTKPQDDTGDPDFIFMLGDEIDVKEVLAEQLIVLEPVAECPEKDEKTGACRLCHRNPTFVETPTDAALGAELARPAKKTGQGLESSAFSALSELANMKKKEANRKS